MYISYAKFYDRDYFMNEKYNITKLMYLLTHYLDENNNEVASFCDASVFMNNYGLTIEEVIDIAKANGYNVFEIVDGNPKTIIASPELNYSQVQDTVKSSANIKDISKRTNNSFNESRKRTMSESKTNYIELYYPNLEVTVWHKVSDAVLYPVDNSHPAEYDDEDKEIEYTYKASEHDVIDALFEYISGEDEFKDESESDIEKYIKDNLNELVEEHNDYLLKYFEDSAREDAESNDLDESLNEEWQYCDCKDLDEVDKLDTFCSKNNCKITAKTSTTNGYKCRIEGPFDNVHKVRDKWSTFKWKGTPLEEELEAGDSAYHPERDEYYFLKKTNKSNTFELYTYSGGKFVPASPRFIDKNSPFYNKLKLVDKNANPEFKEDINESKLDDLKFSSYKYLLDVYDKDKNFIERKFFRSRPEADRYVDAMPDLFDIVIYNNEVVNLKDNKDFVGTYWKVIRDIKKDESLNESNDEVVEETDEYKIVKTIQHNFKTVKGVAKKGKDKVIFQVYFRTQDFNPATNRWMNKGWTNSTSEHDSIESARAYVKKYGKTLKDELEEGIEKHDELIYKVAEKLKNNINSFEDELITLSQVEGVDVEEIKQREPIKIAKALVEEGIVDFRMFEDIEKHDTLNPKLWNTETQEMLPEVREKLLEISQRFIDAVHEDNLDLDVQDIVLIGSNANYNYTKDSDLDIHIVASSTPDCNKKHLNQIYQAYKTLFNNKYDITVKGYPAEVYVEMDQVNALSGGIYSIKDNKWLKEPQQFEIPDIDKDAFNALYKEWEDKYNAVLESGALEDIDNFIDSLYELRKTSIAEDGEFSLGNLVFKELRNKGFLDHLKEMKTELTSKELSLEHLEEEKVKIRVKDINVGDIVGEFDTPEEAQAFIDADLGDHNYVIDEAVEDETELFWNIRDDANKDFRSKYNEVNLTLDNGKIRPVSKDELKNKFAVSVEHADKNDFKSREELEKIAKDINAEKIMYFVFDGQYGGEYSFLLSDRAKAKEIKDKYDQETFAEYDANGEFKAVTENLKEDTTMSKEVFLKNPRPLSWWDMFIQEYGIEETEELYGPKEDWHNETCQFAFDVFDENDKILGAITAYKFDSNGIWYEIGFVYNSDLLDTEKLDLEELDIQDKGWMDDSQNNKDLQTEEEYRELLKPYVEKIKSALIVDECLHEDAKEDAFKEQKELVEKVYEHFSDLGYHYDMWPENERDEFSVDIDGDWKHDHLHFEHEVNKFLNSIGYEVVRQTSEEVGESDDDSYEAIHTVKFKKNDNLVKESLNNKLAPAYKALDDAKIKFNVEGTRFEFDSDEDKEKAYKILAKTFGENCLSSSGFSVIINLDCLN